MTDRDVELLGELSPELLQTLYSAVDRALYPFTGTVKIAPMSPRIEEVHGWLATHIREIPFRIEGEANSGNL